MATLALNSGLWVRRLLNSFGEGCVYGGTPFQGRYPTSEVNDGGCPENQAASAGSGLTCPDYGPLVKAFGFSYRTLHKEDDTKQVISTFLAQKQPTILEVFMAPDQLLVPKFSISITAEGKLVSPPLEDLSPLIPMEQLKLLLLVPVHANSTALNRKVAQAKGDAIY